MFSIIFEVFEYRQCNLRTHPKIKNMDYKKYDIKIKIKHIINMKYKLKIEQYKWLRVSAQNGCVYTVTLGSSVYTYTKTCVGWLR